MPDLDIFYTLTISRLGLLLLCLTLLALLHNKESIVQRYRVVLALAAFWALVELLLADLPLSKPSLENDVEFSRVALMCRYTRCEMRKGNTVCILTEEDKCFYAKLKISSEEISFRFRHVRYVYNAEVGMFE